MTVIVGLPEQPANRTIAAIKMIKEKAIDLPAGEFIQEVCASKFFLSSGIFPKSHKQNLFTAGIFDLKKL
jgi:hypothetical protein